MHEGVLVPRAPKVLLHGTQFTLSSQQICAIRKGQQLDHNSSKLLF